MILKRMMIMVALLFSGAVVGQTTKQPSKSEVSRLRTEIVNCLGETSYIWDYDQDGWDDIWLMIYPEVKRHLNRGVDTDGDGVTDYDEMLLWRNPMTPGPLPRKLTKEEREEQSRLNERFLIENHAKQAKQWEKDLQVRTPYILTEQTKKKFEERQIMMREKSIEDAKKNPTFVERGYDAPQSLFQITKSNGAVSVSATGYNLTGAGVTVAVMEDSISSNHADFTVTRIPTSGMPWAENHHTTAVSGIIASSGGLNAQGRGVAPGVTLQGYQINPATSVQVRYQVLAEGFSSISNHSYGPAYGWTGAYQNIDGQGVYPTYEGNLSVTMDEPNNAGQYRKPTQAMDEVAYLYPQHLFINVAGNSRANLLPFFPKPPEPDQNTKKFYSRDNNNDWVLQTFAEGEQLPKAGGENNYGFDSLTSYSAAKNPICVGSIYSSLTPWANSGFGPTDDGRLKPDLVALGAYVTAPYVLNNTSYYIANWQGTSFAAPVVTGAAALITQQMKQLLPANAGLATSDVLKGILIHSADDIDNVGPDYRTGWGNLNIDRAVELTRANCFLYEYAPFIKKFVIQKGQISRIEVVAEDNVAPFIKATLVWNDPPADVLPGLDVTCDISDRRLINDLDLYVLKPGQSPNEIERPWVLDPASPALPALRGVNSLDNVEQVYIDDAVGNGVYTIIVDGTKLVTDMQAVSLVFTGNVAGYEETKVIKITEIVRVGEDKYSLGWQSRAGKTYTVQETTSFGIWNDIATDIQAIGDHSFFIVPSDTSKKQRFWRVREDN